MTSVLRWPGAALRSAPDKAPRSSRWLVVAAASFVLSAILAAGLLLGHLYRRDMARAEREIENLALVLANYTENTFRSVELLHQGLMQLVTILGVENTREFDERLSTQAVNLELRSMISALPQIEALFLTNAQGVTIASSRAWPLPVFSIADRPHFSVLRDDPQLATYLAPPARNIQTGTWNIYLSRRLETANGEFLGIAGVGIGLTDFEEFLGRIDLGPTGVISLWRRDLVLMARFPHPEPGQNSSADADAIRFAQIAGAASGLTYHSESPLDGVERIIAARALSDYPVIVTVSRSVDDVLASWWQHVLTTSIALVLVTLTAIGGALLGIRHLQSRDQLATARTALSVLEEQRKGAARIDFLAHHDALTGLANRALLRSVIDGALVRAKAGGKPFAVLYLDLDHFKDVNDTLGHGGGDTLLQAVAGRCMGQVRQIDTIARLGGDEFAFVQMELDQPKDAGLLAQRLVEELRAPFEIDGHRVVVGASIGIAVAPRDGLDADTLLKNADMALYRAKAAGRSRFRYFEQGMHAQAQKRRRDQFDLRRALENQEFELYYQKQVTLPARRLIGFEALLRWRDPYRGLILPDQFISLAEEMGLIIPLGEWVLHQACAQAAAWPTPWRVAVNLSPVQFGGGRLYEAVRSALALSGLDPARLELEITESVLLRETEETMASLHRLRELGVAIALDDFGVGYSSLGYLQRFPFDRVKIDRSFVASLGYSRESNAIVRSVVTLGTALDMSITAEGVENEAQCALLAEIGCHEAQGFLFGKPEPADTVSLAPSC
ncbi:putative bifunctional diguanylate cyclase/phosphodiesterase [Plastoroseomonas arctica]|uniref:EAL domain-containing protein n=1 Tax=Plastoroseomonas arctica TaxID=1509237 RepID=A0AAF1JYQ7_9PROT|nr:EAL domain-containing protein [Plastoroseomonas arctica]MBR0655103.1 EAL domain-containing protein [Plastoroseomonas arctica]